MEKWLHVFRVRCEHLEQPEFFSEHRDPVAVILDAFDARPTTEVGGGSEWHIADTEIFAGNAAKFQIGRVQKISNPQFNERDLKFYEAEGERAPYANGVFDGDTQTCVIERKSSVSPKAIDLAPKLEKLLNSTRIASKSDLRIVVDELRDPENFIEQIRGAERVVRFSFSAEFENPHDVAALIHKPAERYNEAIGGEKTTIESRGQNLDKEIVEEMARSAASVGDPASATVKEAGATKGRAIYLRGTPLLEKVEMPEQVENLKDAMLSAARRAYHRIRKPQE